MESVGRRRILGLGLATILAVGASGVSAQEEEEPAAPATSAIEGRVMDADGAPLGSASVTVVSFDMPGAEASLTTDNAGTFRLAPIPAGLYDIFIVIEGFRRAEWRDLRVEDDRTARIDIKMERRTEGGSY